MSGIRIDATHQAQTSSLDSLNMSERNSDFSEVLSQTQKIKKVELQTFLDRLKTQGEKLARSLSIRDLKDFRNMIKSFLRSTFGQSRQMQEESSWSFQGQSKVMVRTAKIDRMLEDLGKQLLDQESQPLEILTKIDDIRGLIIDLLA